jgi:endonuclease/exonuclease/phosphatase family metal-dependent hydrolase
MKARVARLAGALGLAFTLGTVALAAPPLERPNADRNLTVMTRNLYLGADLGQAIGAAIDGDLAGILLAVEETWQRVVATDYPARAKAIAAEIADKKPALVGLQEAVLWRSQTPADGMETPATHVEYDFIGLLLHELAENGVRYEVAAVDVTSDVEMPRLDGGYPFEDVRLTDRDAILVRSDLAGREMKLTNVQSAVFDTRIPILPGIDLLRGWSSVDVNFRGRRFRFVNTHLEAELEIVRVAQAYELLAGPLATTLPLLVVGDFNSDGDGVVDPAAYQLIREAGFADTWADVHPGDPGYTCCQEELLTNSVSLLDQRIDHVFSLGAFERKSASIFGDDPSDRVFDGSVTLWPSDHAGLAATFNVDPLPELE